MKNNRKMHIKSVKMKMSKNKKMVPRSKDVPCSPRTDRRTDRVTTVGILSGFQDFFLQPIIKDWPNITLNYFFLMS